MRSIAYVSLRISVGSVWPMMSLSLTIFVLWAAGTPSKQEAIALLLPDASGNKLELQPQALARIEELTGPVSVVSAIGQYRSGKSYLLNQLMQIPCSQGFMVGHQRHTQTKGVWFLEATSEVQASSQEVHVLYFDTEGFDGEHRARCL